MKTIFKLLSVTVIFACVTSTLFAQSGRKDTLPEAKRAAIVFDLRIDKLKESRIGKMGEETLLDGSLLSGDGFENMTRVFGQTSALTAKTFADGPGENVDLPFEMFVYIQFSENSSAAAAFAEMHNGETVIVGDKEFHTFGTDGNGAPRGPTNAYMRMFNDTTIEVGTELYLTQPNRRLFSERLETTWGGMADESLRVAIDLEQSSDLVSFLQQMSVFANPEVKNLADSLNKVNAIRLGLDFSQSNLLNLSVVAKDGSNAREFGEAFDEVLNLGKTMGNAQVAEIRAFMPDVATVAVAVLSSLNTTVDGTNVRLTIPRPEGLDQIVETMAQMAGPPEQMEKGRSFAGPGEIEVTAKQIAEEYEADQEAADAKYKGKTIFVTGTIDVIGTASGNKFISLVAGDPLSPRLVQCFPLGPGLEEGETVTVHGRCDGGIGGVVLRECNVLGPNFHSGIKESGPAIKADGSGNRPAGSETR